MKYKSYTTDGTQITATEIEAPEVDGYLVEVSLTELSRHALEYRRNLRGIARALWNGSMSFDQAFADYSDNVRIGLRNAWRDGALECGIEFSELTPEELSAMNQVIAREESRVFPLMDWIDLNSKANGGKFAPVQARADMWALRYDDVVTRAKLMACADQKLRWTINAVRVVKENCKSCLKLDGKVKRASYWARENVHPQQPPNPNLECGGWLCGCGLVQTDEPLSRGPLPRLP